MAFREQVEYQRRDHHERDIGHNHSPIGGMLALKLHDAQRHRPQTRAIEYDQWEKKVIPAYHRDIHNDHSERGTRQWKQDTPEEIDLRPPINVGSVLQFLWHSHKDIPQA